MVCIVFISCSTGVSQALRWGDAHFCQLQTAVTVGGTKRSNVPIKVKTANNVNNASKKKNPNSWECFIREKHINMWFSYNQASWEDGNSSRRQFSKKKKKRGMVLSHLLFNYYGISLELEALLKCISQWYYGPDMLTHSLHSSVVENAVRIGINLHAWMDFCPY